MASFSLQLPLAATAVPIEALRSPNASESAPAGTPSGAKGPGRPGVIPPTSLRPASGSDAERSAGPRRPAPAQN